MGFHALELIAPPHTLGQLRAGGIKARRRCQAALSPHPREHRGIHPIRFRQVVRAREMPCMGWIDARKGLPRGARETHDKPVRKARGLENQQVLRGETAQKRADRGLGVGDADGLGARVVHVQPVLRKVDADRVVCHGCVLSMSSCSKRPLRHMQLFRLVRPTGGGPNRRTG